MCSEIRLAFRSFQIPGGAYFETPSTCRIYLIRDILLQHQDGCLGTENRRTKRSGVTTGRRRESENIGMRSTLRAWCYTGGKQHR